MTTVAVLARADLAEAGPVLRELAEWLRARGVEVAMEERTAALAGGAGPPLCTVGPGREVAARADVVVVMGGDGTLLTTSHLLEKPVPVLGVNFGSLGFLTDVTLPELFPTLEGVLKGSFRYEERRMLRASVDRNGEARVSGDVLNDVVVTKAALSRIIELEVTVDGLFVSLFRADGLIISSPTGSTAYNLAAGGPILHPALHAMVLTPICPHMLTNRPLVIGDEATVEVRLRPIRQGDVHVTFDGQRGFPLANDDRVTVTRSPHVLRMVKPAGRDYFDVLRTKLKWGDTAVRRKP